MRIWTIIIISVLLNTAGYSQQGPQFSLTPLDPFIVNPAYAGLENTLRVNGIYRSQWVNLPGSPVSQMINMHTPLYFASGGIGFQFLNETLGPEQQLSASLAYNYHLYLNRSSLLSLGVSGGILQYTLDGSRLRTPEGVYEGITIDHQDDRLPQGRVSEVAPLVNVGLYLQTNTVEAGLSIRNILASDFNINSFSYGSERQYMAHLRYFWELGRSLRLVPSVWLRSDFVQTQIDFNIQAQINDNIFGGVSFRGYTATSVDALILQAGFRLNEKITLAYAYDLTLSSLKKVSDGSHEIMIQYDFGTAPGKGRLPAIIYHPRMK